MTDVRLRYPWQLDPESVRELGAAGLGRQRLRRSCHRQFPRFNFRHGGMFGSPVVPQSPSGQWLIALRPHRGRGTSGHKFASACLSACRGIHQACSRCRPIASGFAATSRAPADGPIPAGSCRPRELFRTFFGSLRNCAHRRLRRWRAALDRTVFESKRQETYALMAEKAEVCGTDCGKSATSAENHLSIPRLTHDPHCQCGRGGILRYEVMRIDDDAHVMCFAFQGL
jgi:hypothetical protein